MRQLWAGGLIALATWIQTLKKLSNKKLGRRSIQLIALSSIGISLLIKFDPIIIRKIISKGIA